VDNIALSSQPQTAMRANCGDLLDNSFTSVTGPGSTGAEPFGLSDDFTIVSGV
jgi:hypothetical protein